VEEVGSTVRSCIVDGWRGRCGWRRRARFYHVIARGNERKAVSRDDRDRQEYLDRLIRWRDRFGLRLLAFCLIGNHLHLAVGRGPANLSRVMLALQSA
jgi:REP element-mobilizing transposase RayT